MGKWFCIWDDLPNPTGLNLIQTTRSEGTLVFQLIYIIIGISEVNNFTKIKRSDKIF
jgi:uncharacterized membrane protein YuzA (DUF378 family)